MFSQEITQMTFKAVCECGCRSSEQWIRFRIASSKYGRLEGKSYGPVNIRPQQVSTTLAAQPERQTAPRPPTRCFPRHQQIQMGAVIEVSHGAENGLVADDDNYPSASVQPKLIEGEILPELGTLKHQNAVRRHKHPQSQCVSFDEWLAAADLRRC
jgi:hypothetical protein